MRRSPPLKVTVAELVEVVAAATADATLQAAVVNHILDTRRVSCALRRAELDG